ncbi:acetyltransferase [Anaerorhabdus sp.]|uniref:acetyltransferase n=1 Tax=Anaerorhabdus sp. TaxID=1872524 RepID=UPI002FC69F45
MNRKVILIGNGGHAKVIADIIKLNNDEIVGFIVDKGYDTNNALGLKWLGDFTVIDRYKEDYEFIIAIGSNKLRNQISELYDLKWHTAIHPSAIIDTTCIVSEGTCIMANAVVNSSAKIGKHCIINTGSIVEHDCIVDDYCHLSPNSVICGTVKIGKEVHVGAGSTVINNISIIDNVIIGAGACVVKDIVESGTYVGVPTKKVEKC